MGRLPGLRLLVQEGEEVPEMFNDPLYARAKYWILSTSAIFSKHFPVYGWGEVVPDGFGVAYMTGYDGNIPSCCSNFDAHITSLDRLQFTITSRKEMPNVRFVEEVAKAADDLRDLFEETQNKARL
jgi:carnitine O-acetyltransferase